MMIHHSTIKKFPYTKKSLRISNTRASEVLCTLDLEATTFFYNDKKQVFSFDEVIEKKPKRISDADYINENYHKHAYCYIWQFSIEDDIYYGRYLHELPIFINKFISQYDIRIKIFIQNLSYEFQFIKHLFVFNTKAKDKKNKTGFIARRMHKLQSIHTSDTRIEFIDTLVMSAVSLENMSGKFGLNVEKQSGLLDYSKLRHSTTPLNDDEMKYAEYDCRVLIAYIRYELNISSRLSRLPRTQTGKTRKLITKEYAENINYRKFETARTAPSLEQYIMLNKAFSGGFTHANYLHANKVLHGVKSKDLKSWYPSIMAMEKFPTGKWCNLEIDDGTLEYIREYFEEYAFCLEITFKDIHTMGSNTYLSLSKCDIKGECIVDNGRVIKAAELTTTITEQDYLTIYENYTYTEETLIKCIYAPKEYIDEEILSVLIFLFTEKESIGKSLKLNPDNTPLQVQYKAVKERINAMYGMSVTNYISDIITLNNGGEWGKIVLDEDMIDEQLHRITKDEVLTIPYGWGVWITAYARRGLWRVIHQINSDVVYADTDSVKYINADTHEHVFEYFNEEQAEKLKIVGEERHIDITPLIGVGCFELDSYFKNPANGEVKEVYDEFKTLGAKKYCYRNYKGLNITVSGVPKQGKVCLNDNINNFKDGFIFDYRAGGKQVVYIDNEINIKMVDYLGNSDIIECNSGICIYDACKSMGIGKDYKALLSISNGNQLDDDIIDFITDSGSLLLKTM